MDRVNGQLDKVDKIMDSAVDAADSANTAMRAMSFAIPRPVQKSRASRRVSFGAADFKGGATGAAVQAGKEARPARARSRR